MCERRRSPLALVTASLRRIERLDPELNAFITVTADSAIKAAESAEVKIEQGEQRAPLQGLPIAIKDFYDTAGIRTTAAFEPFRQRVPTTDATAVAKLKAAGAVIVGKTNMHRLGMGTTGLESAFGPVRNPWGADFIAGGSSSGSAAAVASGMCFATLDTDAIGSCRLPAACCGVVGFKGTYALIDITGILAGEPPPGEEIRWLAHAGVTARSVEDVALVLDALVERTREAPSFVEALRQESELRVGVANNLETDRELSKAFDRAVETIRGLGYAIENVAAPLVDPNNGVADIEADRGAVTERCFERIDLMLLPTIPGPVPSVREAEGNPLALSPAHTMFANYFGLPAISIPCGFDGRGLPLGLQIVGRPWGEAAVLRLGRRYQTASGYAERRPPS
jgi:aspartyl-tRNA(Asn)/glutamyl-tRNA(Gln) amidotransferase subunit A